MPFHDDVVIKDDSSGGVGARMPDAVPRNELAEEGASTRDWSPLCDGDRGERNRLADAPALTEWIALRVSCGGTNGDGRGKSDDSEIRAHGDEVRWGISVLRFNCWMCDLEPV